MKDMGNKKKIAAISLLILFILPQISFASDNMLDVSYGGQPAPLFNVENGAPGEDNIKTVSVTNNDDVSRDFGIDVDGSGSDLSEVLILNIDGMGMPLSDYYSASDKGIVWLGSVAANTTRDFEFKLILDKNANNDFIGKEESFSFNLGFDEKVSEEKLQDEEDDDNESTGDGSNPSSGTTTTTNTTTFGAPDVAQFVATESDEGSSGSGDIREDDQERSDSQGEVKGEEDIRDGQRPAKNGTTPSPYLWLFVPLSFALFFALWRWSKNE